MEMAARNTMPEISKKEHPPLTPPYRRWRLRGGIEFKPGTEKEIDGVRKSDSVLEGHSRRVKSVSARSLETSCPSYIDEIFASAPIFIPSPIFSFSPKKNVE